ncbi:MAG: fumarylacetoacetate hydrolase family protein [Candidatus Methanofastidiosia archaeon]
MRYLKVKNQSLILYPTKIVCLARNYERHSIEMGRKAPKEPLIFLKPTSAIIHEEEDILIPRQSKLIHHEVELAIVIGKRGKDIAREKAFDHVFGYSVFIDVTARDLELEAMKRGLSWDVSKGFDTFAPISQIAPKEGVSDPKNLDVKLWVNNKLRQNSNTKYMIFKIPEIISHISSVMTLERGDVIATGTPEGVSFLKPGDLIKAEIEKIGSLRNRVVGI